MKTMLRVIWKSLAAIVSLLSKRVEIPDQKHHLELWSNSRVDKTCLVITACAGKNTCPSSIACLCGIRERLRSAREASFSYKEENGTSSQNYS